MGRGPEAEIQAVSRRILLVFPRYAKAFGTFHHAYPLLGVKGFMPPQGLLLIAAYRRVSTGNVVIPSLLIPQLLQSVRIGDIQANYVQDHRDNPADAHRGFWNTIDTEVASKYLGSQRSFVRVLARNATYTPIGRNLVFARQTQIGIIKPFSVAFRSAATACCSTPLNYDFPY